MIAALDSIKMLELLSKINDLEHELRTVEIYTKVTSPARGRASLATH
jgi:aryl carrier-like protein